MKQIGERELLIIGGGFFGLSIAIFARKQLGMERVTVLEKEDDALQHASYNNQARVHNGYHYPRSLLTSLRSRVNFPVFVKEYPEAIHNQFDKYYAISRRLSKVSASQFHQFYQRVGSPIRVAPQKVKALFDPFLTEEVFTVQEYALNARVLKQLLLREVEQLGIDLRLGITVEKIEKTAGTFTVATDHGDFTAQSVLNVTYSSINAVNKASGLPIIPLKHELVEMCLVDVPPEFKNMGITMMDGPFFSFMPFPDRSLHTLSHVRYTPHSEWHDTGQHVRAGHQYLKSTPRISHFRQMLSDTVRYIPGMKHAVHKDSLWEVKTILPRSEGDDSRPILFRRDHGLAGYHCIMGGKLDNIYDVYKELESLYV